MTRAATRTRTRSTPTAEDAQRSGVQRRRDDVTGRRTARCTSRRVPRGCEQRGLALVVDAQRAVVAARHERAAVEERHVLRRRIAAATARARVHRDRARLGRSSPRAGRSAQSRRRAPRRRPRACRAAAAARPSTSTRRAPATRCRARPRAPAVVREREMPRPLLSFSRATTLAAHDVDLDELRASRVGDERVASVACGRGIARLVEARRARVHAGGSARSTAPTVCATTARRRPARWCAAPAASRSGEPLRRADRRRRRATRDRR